MMTQKNISASYKKLLPIIGEKFDIEPIYVSLDNDSEYRHLFENLTQVDFQKNLDNLVLSNYTTWSISGYLENRASILSDYPQMIEEERIYHLGIDINLPRGTKLYAPCESEIVLSRYESGDGNYGGMTILKIQNDEIYYMLFGHLNPDNLPNEGYKLKKGELFATLGEMSQNGNWFYHTHLQILTQTAYDEGWYNKGYCTKGELSKIANFCPNPFDKNYLL